MTEDERDYGALVASIIEPNSHTDGLAALRRLFSRWHRQEHEPGAGQQRKPPRGAKATPEDIT